MHTLQKGTDEQAAISPDGKRIVFEKQEALWQMGPNGEDATRLFDAPKGARFAGHAGFSNCSGLSWSPDGRWLTYLRKLNNSDALILEARSLSDERTTTVLDDPDVRGYTWLSSTQIVLDRWEAPDRPFSNLWQIGIDPDKMRAIGRPRRLTNWAGFAIENMSASMKARTLAVSKRTDRSDVFIGDLIDTAGILKERGCSFHLEIIGDGPLLESLRTQVEQLGLLDRVKLLGAQPQEVVRLAYQRAAIFALPCVVTAEGDRDGIPTALVEAMASGVGVVSTPVSGIPELIDNGRDGLLVAPNNPNMLAQALERLLTDSELLNCLTNAARAKVEKHFSIERSSRQLLSLFQHGGLREEKHAVV